MKQHFGHYKWMLVHVLVISHHNNDVAGEEGHKASIQLPVSLYDFQIITLTLHYQSSKNLFTFKYQWMHSDCYFIAYVRHFKIFEESIEYRLYNEMTYMIINIHLISIGTRPDQDRTFASYTFVEGPSPLIFLCLCLFLFSVVFSSIYLLLQPFFTSTRKCAPCTCKRIRCTLICMCEKAPCTSCCSRRGRRLPCRVGQVKQNLKLSNRGNAHLRWRTKKWTTRGEIPVFKSYRRRHIYRVAPLVHRRANQREENGE